MVFVDTNIFMYATGGDHPHKQPTLRFFEAVAEGTRKIAISTEILQEILYRFWAIKKIDSGFELFDYACGLSDWVFPVTREISGRAKDLMKTISSLSPRDALYVATMSQNRISTIVSYDRAFDEVDEIRRIEPLT